MDSCLPQPDPIRDAGFIAANPAIFGKAKAAEAAVLEKRLIAEKPPSTPKKRALDFEVFNTVPSRLPSPPPAPKKQRRAAELLPPAPTIKPKYVFPIIIDQDYVAGDAAAYPKSIARTYNVSHIYRFKTVPNAPEEADLDRFDGTMRGSRMSLACLLYSENLKFHRLAEADKWTSTTMGEKSSGRPIRQPILITTDPEIIRHVQTSAKYLKDWLICASVGEALDIMSKLNKHL